MFYDLDVNKMQIKIQEVLSQHPELTTRPAFEFGLHTLDLDKTLADYFCEKFECSQIHTGTFVLHSLDYFRSFDTCMNIVGLKVTTDPILPIKVKDTDPPEGLEHVDYLKPYGYATYVNDLLLRYGDQLEKLEEKICVTFRKCNNLEEEEISYYATHIDSYLIPDYDDEKDYGFKYNYEYQIIMVQD